ncbi:hypothetical protein E2C01_095082 [Portunus trituberculatus]|uniref:Ig-like domain-containing protein n=1 Tax=Portunus trituberculatus TaxID=210409 RepID=A0A5B7JYL2_PORTR|nr:hypothetical protein [Portunus trituberculatus]
MTGINKGEPSATRLPFLCLADSLAGPTRELWAADGRSAHLACNLTSPLPHDTPRLVLWYKKGLLKPIYR